MSMGTRWVIVIDGTGLDGTKPETLGSTSYPSREVALHQCPDDGHHVVEWLIVGSDGIGRDRLAPIGDGRQHWLSRGEVVMAVKPEDITVQASFRVAAVAVKGRPIAWFVSEDDAELFAAALRWSRCVGDDK
jgi:hypothetical protein